MDSSNKTIKLWISEYKMCQTSQTPYEVIMLETIEKIYKSAMTDRIEEKCMRC